MPYISRAHDLDKQGLGKGETKFVDGGFSQNVVGFIDEFALSILLVVIGFLLYQLWQLNTRLQHSENSLAESELRFWQVLKHIPVGVVIYKQGVIQYLNPFTLRLIGNKSLHDVVGRPITDFLHPDDCESVLTQVEDITRTGKSVWAMPVRYITPEGQRKQHEMLANRTRLMIDGEPVTLTIALDITDQNQMIRDIKQQHRMLDVILSSAPAGIWMRDQAGQLQFVNDAYAEMIGVDKKALLQADDDYTLVASEEASARKASDEICKSSGSIYRSSEFYTAADGTSMVCEVIKVPLFEDDIYQGLVGFSLDVTKRVEAEIERAEVQKKALEAQHLESLGVLSGGIAHDFNNLLAVILGNASLIRKSLPQDSREFIFMRRIEETSKKAASLCKQMLTYAGKGTLNMKPLELSKLVHDMSVLLEVSLLKNVSVDYKLQPHLPYFDGDIAQVQQLVMNMITNANEAMREHGGTIRLRTYCIDLAAGDKQVAGIVQCMAEVKQGTYVCLEVSDEGCGMDEATQQRIFEPFFTTKFTGRGLGMSAMLGTVQGHGGLITLESELNQGTTFRVFFPISQHGKKMETEGDTMPQLSHAEKRGKVLIVDDELMLLETAQAMLEDLGYETYLAENGKQALEIYQAKKDEIHVVLLDMTMPEMGGKVCATELLKLTPDLKIIIASGYAEEDIYKQFKGIRLAGVVQKPYDFQRLQEVMF
ncbi:PAS domain-containing hybrid sensor histidine kinase/response regulator [Ghiorsea bivora]|uniref:PAS domain-containing hybrid sensor histidine kinase/response regulator n=1 Tax=Ghiorsea bivora TaxID=1485545 RepID=UPI0018E06740|nr:PAS domain-containing sensor histidine kinase [Ghiorsea bivora]